MKTKNKLIALLEIAIVLCSLFLVAIPAIAAGQNQEMEEVSTNTITTASEDDYVLDIYGNANEDETIDMRDLTYVKLIFFGKKPETELADAKYDGKINPLDFIQIKLIIVGKEKELTVIDGADRIVTVKKPVERIIPLFKRDAEVIGVLGPEAKAKVVSVSRQIGDSVECNVYLQDAGNLPTVGNRYNPNYEAILSLNPDLVISYSTKAAGIDEKLSGSIAVVGFGSSTPTVIMEELVMLGYILGENDRVRYYIDDFHDKYLNTIEKRIGELSEDEKYKVYVERTKDYHTYTSTSVAQQFVDLSGGRHIFADLEDGSSFATVDPEEVIVRNPDVIIKYVGSTDAGFGVDDPSSIEALREDVLNRPELAEVTAVKNKRVYLMSSDLSHGLDYPVLVVYWAKWLYPELFEDVDPKMIHQEYLTEFHETDYDLDEHGVFVYPEPS